MSRVRFSGQLGAVLTPLAILGLNASVAAAAPTSGKVQASKAEDAATAQIIADSSGSATPAHVVATAASGSQGFPASVPVTKIKGEGKTAIFRPSSLTVSEDTTGANCEEPMPPSSFVIKNTGTATAYVTVEGSLVSSIPKGQTAPVCVAGGTAGLQVTLNLSNKKNTKTYSGELTVTTSD
jgi:hypothetical protein